MIKVVVYKVTKVKNEDYEEVLRVDSRYLREDLGWSWVPTIDYYGTEEALNKFLDRLRSDGYDVFEES